MADEISTDGQKGVCVDASMMLMKMMEDQGIWCYGVNGALTIESPSLPSPTHFWPMDLGSEPKAGHVWLVAPPFEIVDVSLGCQAYWRGEGSFLPNYLVAETGTPFAPVATDYCSPELLREAAKQYSRLPTDIHIRLSPALGRAISYFPSYMVRLPAATLRYAAGGVSASDAPSMRDITSRTWNGKLAWELYEGVVKPALA